MPDYFWEKIYLAEVTKCDLFGVSISCHDFLKKMCIADTEKLRSGLPFSSYETQGIKEFSF